MAVEVSPGDAGNRGPVSALSGRDRNIAHGDTRPLPSSQGTGTQAQSIASCLAYGSLPPPKWGDYAASAPSAGNAILHQEETKIPAMD